MYVPAASAALFLVASSTIQQSQSGKPAVARHDVIHSVSIQLAPLPQVCVAGECERLRGVLHLTYCPARLRQWTL